MNYQLNSFVDRKEAEALKELIFKRARERANAMTSDVQADIMTIARDSFVSNKNPFSVLIAQSEEQVPSVENKQDKITQHETQTSKLHEYVDSVETMTQNQEEEIELPVKDLLAGAANQNKMIKEQLTAAQVQNTMIEARQGLSGRKSFMGALAFLNSQAAASLLNKRAGKGIDIVA